VIKKVIVSSLGDGSSQISFEEPSRDGRRASLYLNELIIEGRDWIVVSGVEWSGEYTGFYIKNNGAKTLDIIQNHISFWTEKGVKSANWNLIGGYYKLTPSLNGWIAPVPEPATYGAILGAIGLSLMLWRVGTFESRLLYNIVNRRLAF